MSEIVFEKVVKLNLLDPAPGETTREKVTRLMHYLKDHQTYTRQSGISTARGQINLIFNRSREELDILSELAWTDPFISDEMIDLSKAAMELAISRPVKEDKEGEVLPAA